MCCLMLLDPNTKCKQPFITFIYLFLSLFLTSSITACSNGNCQVMEPCSSATDCAPTLYCSNCPSFGRKQFLCTRGQATFPTSFVNGLPFNKYSWIMTHNSFSILDAPSLPGVQRLTFYNQEDTVTNQLRACLRVEIWRGRNGNRRLLSHLNSVLMALKPFFSLPFSPEFNSQTNGVRGLMLDMYDFENDIWLCHSFQGQCFNFNAFQPAINTLKEVEAFLAENPSEIVTIVIEDFVHTPKGLINLFINAGLDKYWFPVSDMPKAGEDWPTVTEMVQSNRRLLVFTSDASKEAEEGIAYQWRYMVENEFGDNGIRRGSCPHRKESKPLNSRSASLFLQNYFPTYPVEADSCKEHSAPLVDMVNTCYRAAGNVFPNFIAVNYYMRSDGGGVFDIVDKINGRALCGCNTVTACQVGAPFGSCNNMTVPTTSPVTNTAGSFTGYVQFSKSASAVHSPNCALLTTIILYIFKLWLSRGASSITIAVYHI